MEEEIMKKLYRSRESSMLGGVCGGFGEYFNIDPTIVRLIFLLLVLASGAGIVIYVIAWIVVPLRPEENSLTAVSSSKSDENSGDFNKYLPGLILIVVGAVFLMGHIWSWFSFAYIWPVVIILIGIFLVYRAMKPKEE
jgi:phage shock protein C